MVSKMAVETLHLLKWILCYKRFYKVHIENHFLSITGLDARDTGKEINAQTLYSSNFKWPSCLSVMKKLLVHS